MSTMTRVDFARTLVEAFLVGTNENQFLRQAGEILFSLQDTPAVEVSEQLLEVMERFSTAARRMKWQLAFNDSQEVIMVPVDEAAEIAAIAFCHQTPPHEVSEDPSRAHAISIAIYVAITSMQHPQDAEIAIPEAWRKPLVELARRAIGQHNLKLMETPAGGNVMPVFPNAYLRKWEGELGLSDHDMLLVPANALVDVLD